MAKTCLRCQTHIANGRTYCDAHYEEALADYQIEYDNYQNAMQQYYIDVDNWNAMSVEERNVYHEQAEEEALGSIGIFAGLVVGGGFWFLKSDEIPWWMGALVTIFAAAVFYMGRNIFSKMIRGTGYGIGWALMLLAGGWGIEWLASYLEIPLNMMQSNDKPNPWPHVMLGMLGILIGIWREFSGDHHAYGGPVEPIAPSRPSP